MLAAVGIYLTFAQDGGTPADEPASVGRTVAGAEGEEGGGDTLPPVPAPTGSLPPFDIYSYLPMSREELASAADVAERFVGEHGTYSYQDDPEARARRLTAYTTGELGTLLTRTVTAPGTVERDRADQVVSRATGKLKEIRKVDHTSVIFIVLGTETVESKNGPAERAEEYAVTLTQVGDEWRVFDLQSAEAGQEGDNEH